MDPLVICDNGLVLLKMYFVIHSKCRQVQLFSVLKCSLMKRSACFLLFYFLLAANNYSGLFENLVCIQNYICTQIILLWLLNSCVVGIVMIGNRLKVEMLQEKKRRKSKLSSVIILLGLSLRKVCTNIVWHRQSWKCRLF